MTKHRKPAKAKRPAAAERSGNQRTKPSIPGEPAELRAALKPRPEQQHVVGPLIMHLRDLGWTLDQLRFGTMEWYVPKSPSEAFKREKGHHFDGFPCDIT